MCTVFCNLNTKYLKLWIFLPITDYTTVPRWTIAHWYERVCRRTSFVMLPAAANDAVL